MQFYINDLKQMFITKAEARTSERNRELLNELDAELQALMQMPNVDDRLHKIQRKLDMIDAIETVLRKRSGHTTTPMRRYITLDTVLVLYRSSYEDREYTMFYDEAMERTFPVDNSGFDLELEGFLVHDTYLDSDGYVAVAINSEGVVSRMDLADALDMGAPVQWIEAVA